MTTFDERSAGRALPKRIEGAAPPTRRRRDPLRKLCHDVQQPAAAIIALAEVMRCETDLAPRAQERLRHVVEQARHISALCRQVLDGSSGEEPILVDLLVAAVAAASRLQYDVTIDVDCPAIEISADRVALRRILDNVVVNACRAAAPGGQVRISVNESQGALIVDVIDDGPGPDAGPAGEAGLGLQIVEDLLDVTDGSLTLAPRPDVEGTHARLVIGSHEG